MLLKKDLRNLQNSLLGLLKSIIFYNIIVILAVTGIGWYKGWSTGYEFGGGIFIGGLVLIGFGIISTKGYWVGTRKFTFIYSQTMSIKSSDERNQDSITSNTSQFRFLIYIILAGIVSLILGSIIQTVL